MTRNKNVIALLAAGLALALSGAAFAQAQPPMEDPALQPTPTAKVSFDQLDKDSDGFVEKSDVPASHKLSLQFADGDKDGDNRLSRAEFDAFENPMPVQEQEEPEEEK